MGPSVQPQPRAFSLVRGGPFYRLMQRLRLISPSGTVRSRWIALFAWLPVVFGEAIRAALHRPPDHLLRDLSLHARLLVAIPLMFLAEGLVDSSCQSAVTSLYDGAFCERALVDPILDRAEKLRDAWWAEASLALAALTGGQLALWRVTGATGLFHGGVEAPLTFPLGWYAGIALPVAQFALYRWLWRWVIWSIVLARIARLELSPIATHPDAAAGLATFARPLSGYAGFGCAIGAVLAGAWGTQVLNHRATPMEYWPELIVFLAIVLAVAVVPLLPFCGHLYRARRRGIAQYGDFATGYLRGFHRKWVEPGTSGEAALGSPDIQSLNDLDGAFDVIVRTRLFVFGMRQVLAIWGAAILPMVPLFASSLTTEALLKKILSTILGGIPV